MKKRKLRPRSETLQTNKRVAFQKELSSFVCSAVAVQNPLGGHKRLEKRGLGHMPVEQLLKEVREVFRGAKLIYGSNQD
jgi:hypothetical protein